jgi:hypothetical protein
MPFGIAYRTQSRRIVDFEFIHDIGAMRLSSLRADSEAVAVSLVVLPSATS